MENPETNYFLKHSNKSLINVENKNKHVDKSKCNKATINNHNIMSYNKLFVIILLNKVYCKEGLKNILYKVLNLSNYNITGYYSNDKSQYLIIKIVKQNMFCNQIDLYDKILNFDEIIYILENCKLIDSILNIKYLNYISKSHCKLKLNELNNTQTKLVNIPCKINNIYSLVNNLFN